MPMIDVEFFVEVLVGGLLSGVMYSLVAIGFVLPLLGTVAALLYRRDSEVPKRECPECGNQVAIHDQVCMKCGRDLEWTQDLTLPAQ